MTPWWLYLSSARDTRTIHSGMLPWVNLLAVSIRAQPGRCLARWERIMFRVLA